ncbi:MAG TPA: FAD-dependent oxidoreductase, partial [Gemmatimonadales bacterium]|nr:FAD-dependent oxidoreductase [Gemmatimonadales bacterium]
MRGHVIILGGGVAGMSAAHELAERDFRVTVFEKGTVPGGKARSFGVPGTATDNRRDLPAEHGFRFFPGFYKHLPDTMKRIPYPGNREGVLDNLVPATEMQILVQTPGQPGQWQSQLVLPARFPISLPEVRTTLSTANVLTTNVGLAPADMDFYAERVWQLLTSCEERRADTLEGRSWWDYIDAANRPPEYQNILGRTPRVLVAADPHVASARTLGDILLQLLFNLTEPGVSADRVLNGPTNEVWIDPWLAYLRTRQVTYHFNAEVRAVECSASGRITGVRIRQNGQDRLETADYYVATLPVERMATLVTPRMLEFDPTLEGIKILAGHVNWMNGIQFYLTREVPSAYGHQMYLGSPWALTSLFQAQFWYDTRSFARHYGDGTVQTVLSVDVSDWNTAGTNGKTARQCASRKEIADEVWAQLKTSLPALADADLHPQTPWHLDPAIRVVNGVVKNEEPLLVNRVNSWQLRPWARTRIPNLFLASDYVRTHTNLATMEAANEAARRAVNAILDESGVG